jgi:hypothetical protein
MKMQVQFKRPVTIGAITYGVGVHDVPKSDTNENWFFDALVKDGDAIVLRDDGTLAQFVAQVNEKIAEEEEGKKAGRRKKAV